MAGDGEGEVAASRRTGRSTERARRPDRPAVEAREVDGVPAFFVPGEGETVAGLRFRVGHADETLIHRGVTHLVEHLALHAIGQEHRSTNGAVAAVDTTFFVQGEPDEVAAFLRGVTAALGDLPLGRLPTEVGVLATEAARRNPNAYSALLLHRYGPERYGIGAYEELGLDTLGPDDVQAWADRWFTIENAALWIHGEWPDDLGLRLGHGQLVPAPDPGSHLVERPGWFQDRHGVVALSAVVRDGPSASSALRIFARRCEDRLRHQDGSTYSVLSDIDRWTDEVAHHYVGADALPENAEAVADGLVSCLGGLAVSGPTEQELADLRKDAARAWRDPRADGGRAVSAAADHLAGRANRTIDEHLGELDDLEAEEVRVAAVAILADAILLVPPGGAPRDRRFVPRTGWSPRAVEGNATWRSRWYDDAGAQHRLVLGPQGLSLVTGAGDALTVFWTEVAAMTAWQNGARHLTGRDGFTVFVHPEEWVDGAQVVAAIDQQVPTSLVARRATDRGSSYLDEVARRGQHRPPAPAPQAKKGILKRRG